MLKNGYNQCQDDHTFFVKHQKGKVTTLIVYVHDIVVRSDNQCEINNQKSFLSKKFEIKDLRHLKYVLGIKVARSKKCIFLS